MSDLTAEARKAILEDVRAGNHLAVAAARQGIDAGTLASWVRTGQQFLDGKGEPDDQLYGDFLRSVAIAEAQSEVDAVGDARAVRDIGAASCRVAIEFLARRFPERWKLQEAGSGELVRGGVLLAPEPHASAEEWEEDAIEEQARLGG